MGVRVVLGSCFSFFSLVSRVRLMIEKAWEDLEIVLDFNLCR